MATHRKLAAWLALFSLLLQLWITAGHFHPEDFAAIAKAAQAGPALTTSTDQGPLPTGALLHEECALCLSVQVAGSAALTDAATLSEAAVLGVVALDRFATPRRSRPPHLLFQTRAPPVA